MSQPRHCSTGYDAPIGGTCTSAGSVFISGCDHQSLKRIQFLDSLSVGYEGSPLVFIIRGGLSAGHECFYRECAGEMEFGSKPMVFRRRIPDKTTCTKPPVVLMGIGFRHAQKSFGEKR
jgi:hypothetical protein